MKSYFLNPHKYSNQHRKGRNAMPTRLGGPLSNEQKARLCILARTAFERTNGHSPSTAEADAWRHDQVERATGKHGLTLCVQDDFKLIQAHFLNLAGEGGQALNAHIAHETEPKRVALFKLSEALAVIGKPIAYAAAICRNQNKCELSEATDKQIWRLVFTVKNRGPKKDAAPAVPRKSAPENNEPF